MKKMGIVLILLFLTACDTGITNLPHGYKYVQIDGVNGDIANRYNVVVVDPNVERYDVIGDFIVGERSDAELDQRLSRRFGYFILDTRDGKYVEGLKQQQFERELQARGLPLHPL
jgi:hypothetical protein